MNITETLLKATASWFLYIFIPADAPLNGTIMRKRNNQITWLKRIDAIAFNYNYAELKQIVYDGIVEKYGKTPAEILESLYNASPSVSAIGDTAVKAQAEQISSKFWNGVKNAIDFILSILKAIGIGKTSDIEPLPSDWNKPLQNKAGIGSTENIIPIVVVGGILFYLYNIAENDNKTKKRKKN